MVQINLGLIKDLFGANKSKENVNVRLDQGGELRGIGKCAFISSGEGTFVSHKFALAYTC